MKSFIFALCALGLAAGASMPAFAAARNFDCSKPANANKTACKTAAKAAPAPAKAAAKITATTTTKTVTRSYDCTKAGNKNKAQCKGTTSVATSVSKPAPAAQPSLLQRMKNAVTGSSAPAAKPAPKARRTASAAPASVEEHNPAGAIAQCKDGTYSHAKARTGACARHGGVAKWS